MSFGVKKIDVAGLAKTGLGLMGQESVVMESSLCRNLAKESINGNMFMTSQVSNYVEVPAKVQVGMTRKPSM